MNLHTVVLPPKHTFISLCKVDNGILRVLKENWRTDFVNDGSPNQGAEIVNVGFR